MDINVIKQRRKELESSGNTNNNFWKPVPGQNIIRIVPYKFNLENPFIEVWWHYNINKKHYLCNRNFGEKCPICKLGYDLWKEGTEHNNEQDKSLSKKLFANMSYYVPIIVRGKESEGVKYYRFSKTIYELLTNPLINGLVDDYTDPETGYDIIVTFKTPKETNSTYGKTLVDISRKSTPLLPADITSEELMTKILDEQEEVLEILKNSRASEPEMEKILEDWFAVPENNEADDSSENENPVDEKVVSNDVDDIMKKFKDIIEVDDSEK